MGRGGWLLFLLAVVPAGAQVRLKAGDGVLTTSARGHRTTLRYRSAGVAGSVVLPVDDGLSSESVGSAKLLGVAAPGVLILQTSHGSHDGYPMKQCGAGTETMVRVVRFVGTPAQTFEQMVESCWRTIDLESVVWDAQLRLVTIETSVVVDAQVKTVRRGYRVGMDGVVAKVSEVVVPD